MPTTLDAIVILIFFIAPGFFAAQMVQRKVPGPLASDGRILLQALVYSLLIHLVLLPWTARVVGRGRDLFGAILTVRGLAPVVVEVEVLAWLVVVLFVAPLAFGALLLWLWKAAWTQSLLSRFGLSAIQLTPQAWDRFFQFEREGCWIVAEMTDGSLIGGEFGERSFASLSPNRPDLYLEKQYIIDQDHRFGEPVPSGIGVWINGDGVKAIHFYRVDNNPGEVE